MHETIAKVGDDIGRRYTFNTAIAAIMELLNAVTRASDSAPQDRAVKQEAFEAITLMLAPMVPHIAESLWRGLGHEGSVMAARWPAAGSGGPEARHPGTGGAGERQAARPYQRGGRCPPGADRKGGPREPSVQPFVQGKDVKKIVVVPGKLVNVVVA